MCIRDRKCTLDLVLSSSTRANTIQTIALASKGGQKFLQDPLVEGLVGTFFGRSGRPRDVHARVPPTAASDTARPCRLDGDMVALRGHVPIQTRSSSRNAFEHSRYMRPTLLVNQRRSSHRAGKVEQMSRALALVALMHLSSMPSEHPFMLDVASSPLTKLPCSPPRTNRAFGRLDGKWWLQELGEQRQRCKLFGTLALVCVVAAVLARAPLGRAEATERRSCELDRLGCPCSQRVILPSLCVSCAPLLEAHGTLVGAILACVLRYARTCAAAVAALPLRRSRWIARPQTPLAAVDGSGNGDLHVCAV